METIEERYAAANERVRVAKIRWLREAATVDIPHVVRQLELNIDEGKLEPQVEWVKRYSRNPNVKRGGLSVAAPLPKWIDCLIGDETFKGLMKFTIAARIPQADPEDIHYFSKGRRNGYEIRVNLKEAP